MNLALVIILAAAVSVTETASPRYLDCLLLVEADIEVGREAAQQWAAEGGGAEAQHCLAMADIAAGYVKLGAARLTNIANRKDAGDDYIRARLHAQAAEAWLQAGQLDMATDAIDTAFQLIPDSGELHLTSAKIHAAKKEWQQTIASVTTAEQSGFYSADAYILRGRAYMAQGDFNMSANDVVRALTIDSSNIPALLLRGELQQTGIVIEVSFSGEETGERN